MPEGIIGCFQAMFLDSEYVGTLFFFNPRKYTCQEFSGRFYKE
jgi:hypothetical protein